MGAATTREQLELLVKDMEGMADTIEARGGRCTADENKKLKQMMAESNRLANVLKGDLGSDFVGMTGPQLVKALAGTPSNDDGKAYLANLAAPSDGRRGVAKKAFGVDRPAGEAPPIAFSDQQIAELYDACISGRSVTIDSKAPTFGADAPMAIIPAYKLPPLAYRREPTRVADLLPTSDVDGSEVDYYRVTTPASAAAAVAEGAAKPLSTLIYGKVIAPIVKVAHYIEVGDETLSDYAQFTTVIQEELLAGLALAENNQLLNGSGVAPNMTGILTTTGILTRAKATDTGLDALFKGLTDLRNGTAYAEPDGIVMHPTDYQTVSLLKESGGKYIIGDPKATGTPTLWGVPVTLTTQIAAGTALIGAFREGAEMFVRWAPRVEAANQGTTQFVNNTTLIRAEERIGLAVYRPTMFLTVTGL